MRVRTTRQPPTSCIVVNAIAGSRFNLATMELNRFVRAETIALSNPTDFTCLRSMEVTLRKAYSCEERHWLTIKAIWDTSGSGKAVSSARHFPARLIWRLLDNFTLS